MHFCFLWFYISLTLYSSSLSIISSSSAVYMYCLLNWSSLYHVSRSLLNMLWIAHLSSSFSWNVSWPIFFVILKDPYLFWFSFLESHVEWIFLAPSHTLLSSFKSCRFHLFLSNYFFIASFTTFIDFFTAFQLLCSLSRKFFSFSNFVFTIRSPLHRCFLKFSLNRVYSVATCFLSLYCNFVTDNYSVQSFCW